MTTADNQFAAMQPVVTGFDWFGVLKQYGLATFIAVVAIAYFGFVFEVQRRNQERFMESVIKTNEARVEVEKKQTEIQAQQARALSEIAPLLQQIRDDQRRGVWLDKPSGKAGT